MEQPTSPQNSIQGRRLAARNFPSPAHVPAVFSSTSICIVDLGSTFIVITLGSESCPPHHKGIFRLEADRSSLAFEDNSTRSNEECVQKARGVFFSWDKRQKHHWILSSANPVGLRETIVERLLCVLQRSPHLAYEDSTGHYDNGAWIKSIERIRGEWCFGLEQYSSQETE